MAIASSQILIVGCGPGGEAYISLAAREAAASADVLLGSQRLLDMFAGCPSDKIPWHGRTEDMLERLAELLGQGHRVAVLVSGDPGIFSGARRIIERFDAATCQVIPAVSSVQVAFARLGLEWTKAKIISAHGRSPDVNPTELACFDKTAVLAGTREAMDWCGRAAKALEQTHVAIVCENLTLDDERIRRLAADDVATCEASSLSIVLLVRKELIK